jgi:hypothetical protein
MEVSEENVKVYELKGRPAFINERENHGLLEHLYYLNARYIFSPL